MAGRIASAKEAALKKMRDCLDRAVLLHSRIVQHGATSDDNGGYAPFSNPDKRDLTVFVFFESAAAFEHFAQQTFSLAVRKRYDVQPKLAAAIGGNIDRGMQNVMGWAAAATLVSRARAAFGKQHFLSKLQANLGAQHYEWLNHAHRVRNRIAHPGEQARAQMNRLLGTLGVPPQSRKGLSMGRLLAEYPAGAAQTDKWFHRFLVAYRGFADLVERKL